MTFQRLLVGLVDFCRRNALPVVFTGGLLAAFAGWYAADHLGINTDTDEMFAASLPWRQRAELFKSYFPQFRDLLVAVVDAKEPEEAEATAAALAERLAEDHTHFLSVNRPDASPFLKQEGMLFLDTPQLESLLDRTIDAQPFLGELAQDPSARGVFKSLGLLGTGVVEGKADLAGPYKFVLVQPKLDLASIEPGGAATREMREAAAGLEFVKSGDARMRITGNVALADEEFASVAQGAVAGLAGSVLLISLWLFLAVHSWRLIVPILLTLGLGLMLTLLFAATAVGTLNLVSVGFGILFVGIAVDFAIQFCVRYREHRHSHSDPAAAMAETGRRVGGQILVAAAATSAGFLAFVPTDFRGVAELGLIAGVGMLIAFLCTMTFLPAAISLLRPRGESAEVGFRWAAPLDEAVRRRPWPILAPFGILAVLGIVLLPRLGFDADPLHTKDPNGEAMRTLHDLGDSRLTNPFTIDIMVPDAEAAAKLADRLRGLPMVSEVLSINSFVPADQQSKLALVADAATLLGPTLTPHDPVAQASPDEIRTAASKAREKIVPALAKLPSDHVLSAIAGDLGKLEAASDQVLVAVDQALTRFLPSELDQLRQALGAQPVSLQTLPSELARDWVLADGRARVQVIPKPAAGSTSGLREFVAAVTAIAPDAGGPAVTIGATSATIIGSFRSAAVAALVAITAILFVALRRIVDVSLVLAPLLLSSLMTVVVIVLLPLLLNYANIIALPLLLGVGVSFNIYFVMNWRAGRTSVLGSATARAILFSALTTGTAFGSLALSRHPGTASMGRLLLISLGCTLVASLAFIPALLAAIPRPRHSAKRHSPAGVLKSRSE